MSNKTILKTYPENFSNYYFLKIISEKLIFLEESFNQQ